jgi:hypothetical protein
MILQANTRVRRVEFTRPVRRIAIALGSAVAALAVPSALSAAAADCTLVGRYGPKPTGFFRSADGIVSFVADLDINTDGSPRSYHPDDPGYFRTIGGRPRLDTHMALNSVCNGVNIRARDNSVLFNYKHCGDLIRAFTALKATGWRGADGSYVDWYAIPPVPGTARPGTHNYQPCVGADGYFLSQTATPIDSRKGSCDPERWPDALALSSIVMPLDARLRAAGVGLRDFVVVRDPATGRTAAAIIADTNSSQVGEGSVRLAMTLKAVATPPTTYRQLLPLALGRAEYFVIPGSRTLLTAPSNHSEPDIQRIGAELAARHRLAGRSACVAAR